MTTPDKNKAPINELAPPVVDSQPAPGNEPYAFVLDPVSGKITFVPASENGSPAAPRPASFDLVTGKITFS